MGLGDVLYAAGVAEKLYAEDPRLGQVVICDCAGKRRMREEWEGNPAVYTATKEPARSLRRIRFGGGCLPYHPWHRDLSWRAQDNRGHLYLNDSDRAFGQRLLERYGPFVLVEPGGKDRDNTNRSWPGWADLIEPLKAAVPELRILQLYRPLTHVLPGTELVPHENFRQACAAVAVATLNILTEGGITAGAAAVGAPAVISIYGGNVDPVRLGYPEHFNVTGGTPACWSWRPCAHCATAWESIVPKDIATMAATVIRGKLSSI